MENNEPLKKDHVHEWQLYRLKAQKGKPSIVMGVCKICLAKEQVELVPDQHID
jgi:hypothetical protein